MRGQWIGRFSGSNAGVALVEVDEVGPNFEGQAYVFDDRQDLPSANVFLRIPVAANGQFEARNVPLNPLDANLDFTTIGTISKNYPNVTFPQTATVTWAWDADFIDVCWVTDIQTSGSARLVKTTASRPSNLVPLAVNTWDEFQDHVRRLEQYRYMYRGQNSNEWRLCTAFHRTTRSDLLKFLNVDTAMLQQHLAGLTPHFFNLNNPIENAAFLSLAQHHGYPTPLLDWTYSPFIAAYFAFKQARTINGKVRIFLLDRQLWRSDYNQLAKLMPARPHFSILDPIAINNPRLIPQQALSTITNLEDIEEYIELRQKERGRVYLQAIDLPVSIRSDVLRELSMMGIAAGSLFPGLDGACEQLRDRFFGY